MILTIPFRVSITLLTVFMLLQSCSNSDELSNLNPTELEVTVRDSAGLLLSGASVKVFRNLRDLETKANIVTEGVTQSDGRAKFTNLQPVNYYFLVEYIGSEGFKSNYGNYQKTLLTDNLDNGSNFILEDNLTENGLTKITINCTYYRPTVPQTVKIDGIQFFYTDNLENSPPSLDTIMIYLAIFENVNFDIPINLQLNKIIHQDSSLFNDLSESSLGLKDNLILDIEYDIEMLKASVQTDGTLIPNVYLIPLYFNKEIGVFDYALDYLVAFEDVGNNLISIIESGKYPYRFKDDLIYFGNDQYEMDFIINWK